VETTVEERPPVVRCYECGSSRVSALCHHCWRPGCAKHVLPSPPWARRLFGGEGGGPGLQNARARHCGDCAHAHAGTAGATRRWLTVGLAGTGLAVIGLVVVWLSFIAGVICLLVGGLPAALAYLRVHRHAVRGRAAMPVALYPKVTDLELVEELRGEVTLGSPGGDYQTVLKPVEGTVSMSLTFGRPDRDRVWNRQKRLRAEDPGMRYCAGRLVLQGPFGIKEGEQISGPVLALDGDVGDYPVFRAEDPPSASKWNFARGYELRAKPDISSGPVWITPSIVPESDRHTLELDVQWVEFGPDEDQPLILDMIELLRLEFPVSWGEVHSLGILQEPRFRPRAVGGLTEDGRRSLELKRWSPAKPEEDDRAHRPARLTLSIRFEGQIEPEDEISGRVKATMQGTLSGVTGVRLFNSLGERRGYTGKASIKTRVDANFRLSLASIRYQASRVVPDRAAEDSDRDSYADKFDIVPGDETVIALTNAMSEEGYYVKHVIENPPRSGKRADLVQRYWDIAGRRYEGVYPIDFHIILTGEEVHTGDIRPERGTTKVRIVVKGAYTDDDMETRIGDEWKRLHELTLETLRPKDSVIGEQA
jgi:hypothetical protein